MSQTFTVAKFWKCALQVNPASYNEKYRGQDHELSSEEYNDALARICVEENIKIIGIADHGNVDAVDAMRTALMTKDIVVFPGFEIASSEKIHFVCLFSESTTKDQLNRYLGNLELTDPANGIRPSKLGGTALIDKVNELGGFIYAAHITDDNGVLKSRHQHIWKHPGLKAAQIPGSIDDTKPWESGFYYQVLHNKDPNYYREKSIAILNAKDIEKPETLRDPKASCLTKMTTPSFAAFKVAFLDPQSRVRLNSDIEKHYYSKIEKVKFANGYLHEVTIDPFSDHLNAIIGGRGTGKSTMIEAIRYALELEPIGKEAQKRHADIIKENLGKEKAQIELTVRSSARNGNRYIITRKYPDPVIIKDESGSISPYEIKDILPGIEILGQNEILEVAENKDYIYAILKRFLPEDLKENDDRIQQCLGKLKENSQGFVRLEETKADLEDNIAELPKLTEEAKQFEKLGIEGIAKTIPLLERERSLLTNIDNEFTRISDSISSLKDNLPDLIFISDSALQDLPHRDSFLNIRENLKKFQQNLETSVNSLSTLLDSAKEKNKTYSVQILECILTEDKNLEKSFKSIPSLEGKSGKEVGITYQTLLRKIEKTKPLQSRLDAVEKSLKQLIEHRKQLFSDLTELHTHRSSGLNQAIKSLNSKLSGKLKIRFHAEGNRKPLKDFILNLGLQGIGEKRLQWLDSADGLSPLALVRAISKGKKELENSAWGITSTMADALVSLSSLQKRSLEEVDLPDLVDIELNISHYEEDFRNINDLSTGQKCTAILHLLLLDNKDPLIMDQPEDNLDNAFIADRIVEELRRSKIKRQFLFATHNANIPVFGDAEWIGILESGKDGATLPRERQGSIDEPRVRDNAAKILEGGKAAFLQRKEKYGYT